MTIFGVVYMNFDKLHFVLCSLSLSLRYVFIPFYIIPKGQILPLFYPNPYGSDYFKILVTIICKIYPAFQKKRQTVLFLPQLKSTGKFSRSVCYLTLKPAKRFNPSK